MYPQVWLIRSFDNITLYSIDISSKCSILVAKKQWKNMKKKTNLCVMLIGFLEMNLNWINLEMNVSVEVCFWNNSFSSFLTIFLLIRLNSNEPLLGFSSAHNPPYIVPSIPPKTKSTFLKLWLVAKYNRRKYHLSSQVFL